MPRKHPEGGSAEQPRQKRTRKQTLPTVEQRPIEDKAQQLRHALEHAVRADSADVLLLSGGLDSSMLAALDPTVPAITVVLQGKGPDLRNAQEVAEYVGLPNWYPVEISEKQAMADLPEIMQLARSYDLGMKNDVVMWEGLKYAASLGFRKVRTGDASDELFAGYAGLHRMTNEELIHWRNTAVPQIRLPSSQMGKAMNLQMSYPYLNEEVWKLALTFEPSDIIAQINTDRPGDISQVDIPELQGVNTWGKIVLRKAAEELLPNDIAWRTKTPMEYGSGFHDLEKILDASVTNEDIKRMEESGKHFWNKAHGKLYLMFVDAGLKISEPKKGEYACTWCGGGVIKNRAHCATCGAYPSNQPPAHGLFGGKI